MATKDIESVLRASYIIVPDEYEVEVHEKQNMYVVNAVTIALSSNQELGELLKLKNKIRSMVNKSYKVQFIFSFTT